MTVIFPIGKDKLPFLEREGIEFKVIETEGKSDAPIMQKVNALLCSIELRVNPSNMVSFGHALMKYGIARGIESERRKPVADIGTGFEPGSPNDEAARLAAHG